MSLTDIACRIASNNLELNHAILANQQRALKENITLLQNRFDTNERLLTELSEKLSFPTSNVDKLSLIVNVVSEVTGIAIYEILGQSRIPTKSRARQAVIFYARKYTRFTLNEIGLQIGGRDHSTVVYAIRSYQNLLDVNDETVSYNNDINTAIRTGLGLPVNDEKQRA